MSQYTNGQPQKEDYGWTEKGVIEGREGWILAGGEEAYNAALKEYEANPMPFKLAYAEQQVDMLMRFLEDKSLVFKFEQWVEEMRHLQEF